MTTSNSFSAPAPTSQRAVKVQAAGSILIQGDCPVAETKEDHVLVRITYTGLNPHDWKCVDMSPVVGATCGCDFSGVVVGKGALVTKFEIGDAVFGTYPGNHDNDPDNGAFSEYINVPEWVLLHLPTSLTPERAATLGVGISTIGLALYHVIKLPLPQADMVQTEPKYVLIYGGGTATATLAIQAVKLSGLIPITVCSPKSFERVLELGAVQAWDYRSPSCSSDIRAFTNDNLEYALDCITDSGSMKICYGALGSRGGKYVGLDAFPTRGHTRRNVQPNWVIAWTMLGVPINWAKPYRREAKPKDKAFGQSWIPIVQQLVDAGKIKTHPIEVRDGGLEGIPKALEEIKQGTVQGKKLVFRV